MAEVLLDSLLDTLKVLPFLFVIYLLIEVLEHKTSFAGNGKILRGGLAPLIGSAAGIIPLCGFSVMAAKLYDKGYIRTGTVLAVFIATSDEAVIVLAADFSVGALYALLPLLLIKFVLAVAVGYAANAVLRREKLAETLPEGGMEGYECAHGRGEKTAVDIYLLVPLFHALKIALYLFLITFLFGTLIFFVGEDRIAAALAVGRYAQPFIAAAVGLIPSCASSVIITKAYLGGVITFGAMVAGLSVNAGMGFVILLKNAKKLPKTLALLAATYAIACAAGLIVDLFAPLLKL